MYFVMTDGEILGQKDGPGHLMVGFVGFGERSVFFVRPGEAELHGYFSWLSASQRESPSSSLLSVRQRHCIHNDGNCPIFPVFTAPVIFPNWWLWYTLNQDQPSAPQPGPSARTFLFLSVLFHKGHELVWSTVTGEWVLRPLSRPCVGSRVESFFLLPAPQSAGRHRINSDIEIIRRW